MHGNRSPDDRLTGRIKPDHLRAPFAISAVKLLAQPSDIAGKARGGGPWGPPPSSRTRAVKKSHSLGCSSFFDFFAGFFSDFSGFAFSAFAALAGFSAEASAFLAFFSGSAGFSSAGDFST